MGNDFKDSLKVEKKKKKKNKVLNDNLYEANDIEKEDLYKDYIEKQKKQFEAYLSYMIEILCVLKHYGIVSDYTRFSARIKGSESAQTNDSSKALNDVFGVEVDTATEGEAAFVGEIFNCDLKRTREVIYNKDNGYIAHHFSGYPTSGNIVEKLDALFNKEFDIESIINEYTNNLLKNDKEKLTKKELASVKKYLKKYIKELKGFMKLIKRTVKDEKLEQMKAELLKIEKKYQKTQKLDSEMQPIIECQIKTIQVAISANLGSANHGEYKGENIEEIQEKYDKEGLPRSSLPYRMYRTNLNTDKYGKPKLYEDVSEGKLKPFKTLSTDEMIKTLYPSIILKLKDEREM